MNKDIIYVVYFDSQMYKGHRHQKRKCTYIKVGGAKQIVTEDSKYIASEMCEQNGLRYYDLEKEQKEEWVDKARQRFEIKEFVERVK